MSNRTILEINHDYAHQIQVARLSFVELLTRALSSGSSRDWEPLEQFGIRRVIQCHHSDDRKVIVGKQEYPIP